MVTIVIVPIVTSLNRKGCENMKKMIEALYSDGIQPEQSFRHDKHYRRYLKRQCRAADRLRASLTDEQLGLLEDYLDRANITNSYVQQKAFCDGCKLGINILIEAIT